MTALIQFPKSLSDAAAGSKAGGEVRAGGTDLQERRELRAQNPTLVDLRDVGGLEDVKWRGGELEVGAMVKMQAVADHTDIKKHYPGFAMAAGALATPQIRVVGTLGGNLLQRARCWYYRRPEASCFKAGGSTCHARNGDHQYHAVFDTGTCIAVHPSTLGMALVGYEANVAVHGGPDRSIVDLYGEGQDPRSEHMLEAGEILTHVKLPKPVAGERAAYFRTIARARSEWPLVEVMARMVIGGNNRIQMARVAIGGVATIPKRLTQVEAKLEGRSATVKTLEAAAATAAEGARPLPMTRYKVDMMPGTVFETLEQILLQTEIR